MTTINYTVNKFSMASFEDYPRFYSLILESSIIGLMSLAFGKICLDFFDTGSVFSKKSILKNEKNKRERNKICIILFLAGFIVHIINEMLGLNCYYCNKQCLQNISTFNWDN